MIAHAGLNVSNYKKAKEFYKKILAPLGYKLTADMPEWKTAGYKEGGHTSFWISQKKHAPSHVAFEAKNKKAVDAFYKKARALKARDNGKPGYRKEYWPGYYAAFVFDRDGNNIEAVWYDYKAK